MYVACRAGFSNFLSAVRRPNAQALACCRLPSSRRRLPSPLTPLSRRSDNIDRASQALVQGVPPGIPTSYRALADYSDVPRSTLHHRARGRRLKEAKDQDQRYLKPYEEDVVVKFLVQIANLRQLIQMKFIPSIAFNATRQRPAAERPLKAPGKN
jgi:hypothetical protein